MISARQVRLKWPSGSHWPDRLVLGIRGLVVTSQLDGAGLRTLIALLLGEVYLRSNLQTIEPVVENAVFVEIYLATLGGGDEAVTFIGEQPAYPGAGRRIMNLQLA